MAWGSRHPPRIPAIPPGGDPSRGGRRAREGAAGGGGGENHPSAYPEGAHARGRDPPPFPRRSGGPPARWPRTPPGPVAAAPASTPRRFSDRDRESESAADSPRLGRRRQVPSACGTSLRPASPDRRRMVSRAAEDNSSPHRTPYSAGSAPRSEEARAQITSAGSRKLGIPTGREMNRRARSENSHRTRTRPPLRPMLRSAPGTPANPG